MNKHKASQEKLDGNSTYPVVVRKLDKVPTPGDAFRRYSKLRHCIFFDSAMSHESLGRYSYLCADPFEFLVEENPHDRIFERFQKMLDEFQQPPIAGLPPFQGGLAGLFSYDLNQSLENVALTEIDEFQIPMMAIGAYDVVLAWDHVEQAAWIVSQGFPCSKNEERHKVAEIRADQFENWLTMDFTDIKLPYEPNISNGACKEQTKLAAQIPVAGIEGLYSNFTREEYLETIERTIDYIRAGDIFQVNIAQRLCYPANCEAFELFERLRTINPAPFAAYFDLGEHQVVSASPERFVRVRNIENDNGATARVVETRPIKGTRRVTGYPEADLIAGYELLASEKDRSENVMIVDLMRNDLSKFCEDSSIKVTQLCELEKYKSVLHLVSAIEGIMNENASATDLVKAVFPGGSITGAPKVRAMELISQLEGTARGAYCGSVGYFGFNGEIDLNILIRTVTVSGGWWQIPVGGAIVAMSNPTTEYDETWAKAIGMLRAIIA